MHLSKEAVHCLFYLCAHPRLRHAGPPPRKYSRHPRDSDVPAGVGHRIRSPCAALKCRWNLWPHPAAAWRPRHQKVKKGGTCSTPVKAVPNAGWKFAGWTASLGAASSSSSLSFTVPSNADANGVRIVTAHFEPDEHEHEFVEVKEPADDHLFGIRHRKSQVHLSR